MTRFRQEVIILIEARPGPTNLRPPRIFIATSPDEDVGDKTKVLPTRTVFIAVSQEGGDQTKALLPDKKTTERHQHSIWSKLAGICTSLSLVALGLVAMDGRGWIQLDTSTANLLVKAVFGGFGAAFVAATKAILTRPEQESKPSSPDTPSMRQ